MQLATFTDVSDAVRLALHVAVAAWLPWRAERRLTHRIAMLTMGRSGDLHERIARALTVMANGALTPDEIAALAAANIGQRWTQRELVWLWRMAWSARRRRALTQAVTITGLDHLRASLAHGRGAILLEAHLGKRVLAREAIRQAGFTLGQVHTAGHGGEQSWLGVRVLRPLQRALVRRSGIAVVEIAAGSLGYLRDLTARLGRNELLVVPSVGTVGEKFVTVDALGTTLALPSGIASLARATGAAVLPVFEFEDAAGCEHVVIEAPLPPPAAGDAGTIAWAADYVAVLERWIRRHPEQWFWWFALPTAQALPEAARQLRATPLPAD